MIADDKIKTANRSHERFCFCILGWYFFEDFYEKVYEIKCDKFIISHRDRDFLEKEKAGLFEIIKDDVYFCPNSGLEWGGYHQFNEKGYLDNYDFVIYCHDDLVIKDLGFVQVIAEMFREPRIKVIGNGRNGKDAEFRYGKYKDRMFFNDDDDFVIRTVRGSFFAAKTEIFSIIGNFPVYWNTQFKNPKKGNISLRNFAYLVTKHFGIDSITYLDNDKWLETKYLVELRRGELKKCVIGSLIQTNSEKKF